MASHKTIVVLAEFGNFVISVDSSSVEAAAFDSMSRCSDANVAWEYSVVGLDAAAADSTHLSLIVSGVEVAAAVGFADG